MSLRRRTVDFHFGCARGIGFVSGTDNGLIPYTLAAAAAQGAGSLSFSGINPGTVQLLVVLGADGEYYTVPSYDGSTGTLSDPLPCDVAAGQNVWSFWYNNAHPNAKGYAALVDHALRQDFAIWRKVWSGPPVANAPATIVPCVNNARTNPGSANSGNGWTVTPSGSGGGAAWQFAPPDAGDYRLAFACNKSDIATGDVTLSIYSGGVLIKSLAMKTTTPVRHEVDFYAPGVVDIKLTRTSGVFFVSNMTVLFKDEGPASGLSIGRHMVFGDSWVADANGPAARLAARLPGATVSKSGVGGNKASDLVARFATDVAAAGSFEFVWVFVGPNDISAGVTPTVFAGHIATLIYMIQAIGAVPIIVTPYPGSTDIPTTIDMSRRYMAAVPYWG